MKKKILFLISCLIMCSSVVTTVRAEAKEPWEGAYTSAPFGGGEIREAYCDLVSLVEGNFGALLFSVAGLVAVAMGVFGEGGQSKNILVVSIGALTISTLVSLYFGDMGCGNGSSSGGNQQTRTAKTEETVATKSFKLPLLTSDTNEQVVPTDDADAETEESEAELF